MSKLSRNDLMSLEDYAIARDEFRNKVMTHKKDRRIELGPNLLLLFEDRLTMHYQLQEMLRAEKIFEADGIEEELATYNPLIPDGSNWKATMMIQYAEVSKRTIMLSKLIGIENKVWLQIENFDKIYAIADEDLERATDNKTSAVHFLRFELSPEMITAAKQGEKISAGVEHESYFITEAVVENVRLSLVADLA